MKKLLKDLCGIVLVFFMLFLVYSYFDNNSLGPNDPPNDPPITESIELNHDSIIF